MVVNGVEVPGARPYLDEGHLMVALRPVANAAGLCIVKAAGGHALVRDRSNVDHEIALHVRGKTGYVALRDLPGVVNWDGATSTGELKT
jgi:hypothetical protein